MRRKNQPAAAKNKSRNSYEMRLSIFLIFDTQPFAKNKRIKTSKFPATHTPILRLSGDTGKIPIAVILITRLIIDTLSHAGLVKQYRTPLLFFAFLSTISCCRHFRSRLPVSR